MSARPAIAGEQRIELKPRQCSAFTADTLEGQPLPFREWQVPGMIPARNVTRLDGDGGVGKSTLALQLAMATALGRQWVGQDVRKGNALYFSAEDDADELHRRLNELTVHFDVPYADLPGLKLWPLTDDDAVLASSGRDSIAMTPLWDELVSLCEDWAPRLIVLDALADIFAGNEIDRAQVRQFVGRLRGLAIRTGAAVVLLAHPSVAGMANGSGMSGSTAWNNSVRSRLYFDRPKIEGSDGADPDVRTLTVKKANYAQSGGELRLRRGAGAYTVEGTAGTPSLDLAIARSRVDRQFLDMLTAYGAQRRNVSHRTGTSYAPALFARDPQAGGTTSRAFTDAMNRLFAARAIKIEEIGPPSRRIGILVRTEAED